MKNQFNFYAPYKMSSGKMIYGAAAANRRVADAGGHNKLAAQLVMTGVTMGYNKAVEDMRRQARR